MVTPQKNPHNTASSKKHTWGWNLPSQGIRTTPAPVNYTEDHFQLGICSLWEPNMWQLMWLVRRPRPHCHFKTGPRKKSHLYWHHWENLYRKSSSSHLRRGARGNAKPGHQGFSLWRTRTAKNGHVLWWPEVTSESPSPVTDTVTALIGSCHEAMSPTRIFRCP